MTGYCDELPVDGFSLSPWAPIGIAVLFLCDNRKAITIDRGTKQLRNTGTYNQPLHLMRATFVTNDHSALVYVGDLSPWRHLTARSPCQEVSTTTIHRPLTLDQRHAEFPMCTSQEGTFSHRWPCLLYTSPSPRDRTRSRMPSSA